MEKGVIQFAILFLLLCFLSTLRSAYSLKFELDKEECFSQAIPSENYSFWLTHSLVDTEHSWKRYFDGAVKLKVLDPTGNVVYNSHENVSREFEMRPSLGSGGIYLFCFINSSPRRLPVEFDLRVFPSTREHWDVLAKDEDFLLFNLVVENLKISLQNILFEQDFLISEMKNQAIINEKMSKRAISKAVYESVALVGASVLQVLLLRRLFEKKISTSMV